MSSDALKSSRTPSLAPDGPSCLPSKGLRQRAEGASTGHLARREPESLPGARAKQEGSSTRLEGSGGAPKRGLEAGSSRRATLAGPGAPAGPASSIGEHAAAARHEVSPVTAAEVASFPGNAGEIPPPMPQRATAAPRCASAAASQDLTGGGAELLLGNADELPTPAPQRETVQLCCAPAAVWQIVPRAALASFPGNVNDFPLTAPQWEAAGPRQVLAAATGGSIVLPAAQLQAASISSGGACMGLGIYETSSRPLSTPQVCRFKGLIGFVYGTTPSPVGCQNALCISDMHAILLGCSELFSMATGMRAVQERHF